MNSHEGALHRRVVVTGMGVISPIGNNIPDFLDSLKGGKIGIDKLSKVDMPDLPVKVAAEVKNYNPEEHIPKKEIKRMDLFSQYAISAAAESVAMSGLDLSQVNKSRMGVIVGTGVGGMDTFEREVVQLDKKGKISPLFIPMMIGNMAAGNVAIYFGAKGICTNVVTACASGANCIGEAFRSIKHGYSDIIIAGGTEATVTSSSLAGFNALKALSRAEDPARASIPFDKERAGFVLGEGAGMLVLESYDAAKERGAQILAEIVGYGASCDAYHMTAPSPDGQGAASSMQMAICEAGLNPQDVDYINAHGTSTELNDKAETLAIKSVFGEHSKDLLVSSTKSMTGHLLGAAGAIEAIACILALRGGFVPPTVGYKTPDPECDLNYVPNIAIERELNIAISNSLGFGGHNATLCFKKIEGVE